MLYRPQFRPKNRAHSRNNAVVSARLARQTARMGKRARVVDTDRRGSYMPPENWHEPRESPPRDYRIVTQNPGEGFEHVLSADHVRSRLEQLPAWMLKPLQVVQFSRMTRKKKTFPCYGMQWGNALYLYPIESSLVETFRRPPNTAQLNEARMFGGQWNQEAADRWSLTWTRDAIRDFYLNNILIHELGHLLDERNSSYVDRERYAEWFAIEYGYKPSRRPVVSR